MTLNLSNRTKEILLGLALLIATFVLYLPVRHHEYIEYDDLEYIYGNPHVKEGLTWKGIEWAFTGNHFFMWHPLTSISHLIDYQLFGPNPVADHLINAAIHSLSAMLLFLLLRWMTGACGASFIIAALFAWHPLRVESVAWAAERKDVLCTLFWMLTLLAYQWYARRQDNRRYVLLIVVYALGILTKPMIVTLPFVLLLLDIWPLQRLSLVAFYNPEEENRFRDFGQTLLKLVVEKSPLFLLSAILSVMTYHAQKAGGAVHSVATLPVMNRIENALIAYIDYLKMLAWPANLAVLYPHPDSLPIGRVALAITVLAVLTYFAISVARQRPYVLVGWLWYLGTLVPVIGLVQVGSQAMADRYTYVPTIGVLIIVVWIVHEHFRGWREGQIIGGIIAGVALIGCLVGTHQQIAYWQNTETLFRHATEATPENGIAHFALALSLYERHELDEAIQHYEIGLKYRPNDSKGHFNLGNALMAKGQAAEALPHFQQAFQLRPDFIDARLQFGVALASLKRLDEAAFNFLEVLRNEPNNNQALNDLGNVYYLQQKYSEAAKQYIKSLQLYPNQYDGYMNLGLALTALKQTNDAIVAYSKALEKAPNNPSVVFQIGALLEGSGKPAAAIKFYREALRMRPNWEQVMNQLAGLLATSSDDHVRNGAEAVQLAQQVCEITKYQYAVPIDTLAAAYAETGKFKEAVETAKKALELARNQKPPELAGEIEAHLKLFEAGKPLRN